MEKKLKKIVMIGPVYPFKGGISHYTGMMYHTLAEKYDVRMISFKMQYPKLLYKKEQRDYENDSFAVKDTEYLIHTANPINIAKVAKNIMKSKPDMVIIPWWHPYFAPCFRIMEHYLKDTNVIFVCHNVFPHERFPLDKFLTSLVLKNGNGFIVQSKMDRDDLLAVKKEAIYKLTPHPTYNAFKMKNMSYEEARKILNIDKKENVVLFFGFVREYKGLKHLIKAMPRIVKEVENIRLMIVGDFDSDREDYIKMIEESGIKDNTTIVEGYIPDNEVEKFFAGCNLVALPYESATQSGIVQIAYGFEKPVLVTEVGGLPDVVIDSRTGYVVPPKEPNKIAEAIIEFFEKDKEKEFAENVKAEAYKYSWDRMLEVIEGMWQKL